VDSESYLLEILSELKVAAEVSDYPWNSHRTRIGCHETDDRLGADGMLRQFSEQEKVRQINVGSLLKMV